MLKIILDIVSYLLLSGKWKFEWTVSTNPELIQLLSKALEDGKLTNTEVGLILKEIEKELK